MAAILNKQRQDIQQNNKARDLASFFRSQLILFNSRKKHGILYSVATAAGLFCIPGILSVMGSETEVQLLIQRTIPLPFIILTNVAAVAMLMLIVTVASTILVVPMIIIGILYSMPKRIAFMNRFLLKNISIA